MNYGSELSNLSWIFVKLTVQSSDNQIRTESRYVPIWINQYPLSPNPIENNRMTNDKNDIEVIYPNPASDKITFDFIKANNSNVQFFVYNSQGKLVNNSNFSKGNYRQDLDVSKFPNGIYLINAIIGKETIIKKFIVNH